jgi:hypothetical protein
LSPIFLTGKIPHVLNLQRLGVTLAVARLEPTALGISVSGILGSGPGGVNNPSSLPPESKIVAAVVIAVWLVGWTVVGAWRMTTRDV